MNHSFIFQKAIEISPQAPSRLDHRLTPAILTSLTFHFFARTLHNLSDFLKQEIFHVSRKHIFLLFALFLKIHQLIFQEFTKIQLHFILKYVMDIVSK